MKKRSKKISVNINFSNRWLYTLIFFGILVFTVIGITAYGGKAGSPSIVGHTMNETAPPSPCSSGQYLQWTITGWACSTVNANFTETDPRLPTCSKGLTINSTGSSWTCTNMVNKGTQVFSTISVCGTIFLTSSPTCTSIACSGGTSYCCTYANGNCVKYCTYPTIYYSCSGACSSATSAQTCSNTPEGYLVS